MPVAASAPVTRPFFERPNIEQPYYELSNPELRDAPVTPYPFVAEVRLRYDGVPVELRSVVGDGSPSMVVPAVSVEVSPEVGLVPLSEKTLTVTATVRNEQTVAAKGAVRLELPAGWKAVPESGGFDLKEQGAEAKTVFTVTPAGLAAGREYKIAAVAEAGGKAVSRGLPGGGVSGIDADQLLSRGDGSGGGGRCEGRAGVEGGVSAGDGRCGGRVAGGDWREGDDDLGGGCGGGTARRL